MKLAVLGAYRQQQSIKNTALKMSTAETLGTYRKLAKLVSVQKQKNLKPTKHYKSI